MIFQYILYSADLSYPDFIDVILCEYVCEHMYACTIHISAYIRYALINVFPLKKILKYKILQCVGIIGKIHCSYSLKVTTLN